MPLKMPVTYTFISGVKNGRLITADKWVSFLSIFPCMYVPAFCKIYKYCSCANKEEIQVVLNDKVVQSFMPSLFYSLKQKLIANCFIHMNKICDYILSNIIVCTILPPMVVQNLPHFFIPAVLNISNFCTIWYIMCVIPSQTLYRHHQFKKKKSNIVVALHITRIRHMVVKIQLIQFSHVYHMSGSYNHWYNPEQLTYWRIKKNLFDRERKYWFIWKTSHKIIIA